LSGARLTLMALSGTAAAQTRSMVARDAGVA
jgi:hypothetical protein